LIDRLLTERDGRLRSIRVGSNWERLGAIRDRGTQRGGGAASGGLVSSYDALVSSYDAAYLRTPLPEIVVASGPVG
jgi:hypothetical protein